MSSEELFKAEEQVLQMLDSLDDSANDKDYSKISALAYEIINNHTSSNSSFLHSARAIVDMHLTPKDRASQLLGVIHALCESARESGYFSPVDEAECYESHGKHSATLRNWFIAYGIGVPAILISHESLLKRIAEGGNGLFITALFLLGVLLQVLKAILYKSAAWAMMDFAYKAEMEVTRFTKASRKINDSMALDIGIDVVTILLFLTATGLALRAVAVAAG